MCQVISDSSARRGVGVTKESSLQAGPTVEEVHPGRQIVARMLTHLCRQTIKTNPSNTSRADFIALLYQGVTLTDLQEAEKTIGRARPAKTREEEKEEREKQDKEKQEERKETETKEEDYRSKYRSFEEVRLYTPLLFHPAALKPSGLRSCFFPVPFAALQASVLVVHLDFCHFHSQHCLHPILLQHHPVLQLAEQAEQSDGHHVLLQPLLQRHRKRLAITNQRALFLFTFNLQ